MSARSPAPDFARMGRVALVGAFDGIAVWPSPAASLAFPPVADSLVLFGDGGGGGPDPDDALATNDAGTIAAVCFMPGGDGADDDDDQHGTYFLGGSFSSLRRANDTAAPTTVHNIAAYVSGQQITPLAAGIDGPVHTLYCDAVHRKVWAGGDFLGPTDDGHQGYKGSVAVWDVASASWQPPAFGGLAGPVETIVPGPEPGEVLFGGSFVTRLAAAAPGNTTTAPENTTTTAGGPYLNSTTSSLPASPLGTLGNGASTYLSPVPLLTPLSRIDAGPSSEETAHSNASSLLCTSRNPRDSAASSSWWTRDGSAGKLTVNLYRQVRAVGVRLGNALDGGNRGTTSFRVVTIPDNNVRTLRYTDPATLLSTTCTSSCPLSLVADITAQDFMFVSSNGAGDADELEITGFQIYLEGWTGDGAGLSVLQLLSSGSQLTSAVADENSAVCTGNGGQDSSTTTAVQTTGDGWQVVQADTSISGTIRRVLTTQIAHTSRDRPSVTYYPYIASNGYYALYITTPGCASLPPCDTRTRNVQVEVFTARGALPIVTALDESAVTGDTRQQVFEGYLERSSPAFGVTVRLALADVPVPAAAAAAGDEWTMVAGEVDAVFLAPAINGTRGNETLVAGPTMITGGQVEDGQVVRLGTNTTGTSTSATTTTTTTLGYGTFAWSNTTTGGGKGTTDATSLVLPADQTPLDVLAQALSRDQNTTLGSTSSASGWAVRAFTTVPASSTANNSLLFVGGNFTSSGNYSNLLALDTTTRSLVPVQGQGVDGPVHALVTWDARYVLVGGNFTALQQQQQQGSALAYVAKYDTRSGGWTALAGGVDGVVNTLSIVVDDNDNDDAGHTVVVTGEFENIVFRNGTRLVSGGVATYDLVADDWSVSSSSAGGAGGGSRVWGSVRARAAAAATAAAGGTALAGRIHGVSTYGASGLVVLSGDGSQQQAFKVGSSAIGFAQDQASGLQTTATTVAAVDVRRRRQRSEGIDTPEQAFALEIRPEHIGPGASPASWFDHRLSASALGKRQATGSSSQQASSSSAMLMDSYTAPSIVAVAYYNNATSSSSEPWTIVGGNFTASTGVRNLGIWNPAQATIISPLVSASSRQPAEVVGVVSALDVVDEGNLGWLFVGGDRGFGWVDMTAQGQTGEWKTVPALGNGATGNSSSAAVYAITHRGTLSSQTSDEQVIVAGAFTTAGSLGCIGVCSWAPEANRWSTLGDGLRSGVVSSLQVDGQKNADSLLVAGSFVLSDGTPAAVATYSFTNTSWTALGSADALPGPVKAVTMDNGDVASVWAAGQSSEDEQPFLMRWDGNSWSNQTAGLEPGTRIAQLVFVPLSESHSATVNGNGSMESDRLLLATGLLRVPTQNAQGGATVPVVVNATAALFDGHTWVPMLIGRQRDGSPAVGSGLFYSQHSFSFSTKHYLALGLIVLIAIAISTGLVFLITLIGLLVMFCWRPRDSSRPRTAAAGVGEGEESEEERQRRLGALQAAIFGEKAAAAAGFVTRPPTTDPVAPVVLAPSIRTRKSSSSSSISSSLSKHEPEQLGRPTTVKYSFNGEDEHEVSVMAGERIHVLEEAEGEEWWYVRTRDGQEGVVPAAYIW